MISILIFTPWRPRAAAELNTFAFVPLRFAHLPAIGHRRLALTERWIKRDTRAGGKARAVTDWKGAESWTSQVDASISVSVHRGVCRHRKGIETRLCDHSTDISHP